MKCPHCGLDALLAQTPDPRDVRHLSREEIIDEVTQNRMFVESLGRREAQTPDAPPPFCASCGQRKMRCDGC